MVDDLDVRFLFDFVQVQSEFVFLSRPHGGSVQRRRRRVKDRPLGDRGDVRRRTLDHSLHNRFADHWLPVVASLLLLLSRIEIVRWVQVIRRT